MENEDKIKELISAYIDGALSQEEMRKTEDYLISSPKWQQYYKDMMKLSKTLKTWTDEDMSPDLANKIQKTLLESQLKEDKRMKSFTFKKSTTVFVTVATIVLVGGIFLQTYSQRALQARVRDAAQFLAQQPSLDVRQKASSDDIGIQYSEGNTDALKSTVQYEPYYLTSNYQVAKDQYDKKASATEIRGNTRDTFNQGITKSILSKEEITTDTLASNVINTQYEFWGGSGQEVKSGALQQPAYPASNREATTVSDAAAKIYNGSPKVSARMIDSNRTRGMGGLQTSSYDESYFEPQPPVVYERQYNTEEYANSGENQFLNPSQDPLSTFSIDVDTASYSNIRRFLSTNQFPPAEAVRIEEMVNYFSYNYPEPNFMEKFSVNLKAATCPWNQNHQLVQIGIHGKNLNPKELPPSNLVFLIDVSGSMNQPDKLPLLKEGLRMLVNQLSDNERVAIVVYAGAAGLVLDSTPGSQKQRIIAAIDSLQAGGSTAGGAGIQLAYQVAQQQFIRGGNNRVILASDGDFNVGVSSDFELSQLIEQKRNAGIFLTVLGFGTGNLKDSKMETLADKGNGNYHYIDNDTEARKVLVQELGSTLFTIAKDVKIQVEFNPQQVKSYRLIGYENRLLAKQDFNDDTKDAGELGAGHTVTALYEIETAFNYQGNSNGVDPLKYQPNPKPSLFQNNEIMTVKLRYKEPQGNVSKLIKKTLRTNEITSRPDDDLKFASAVAEFGLMLKNSAYRSGANYEAIIQRSTESIGKDTFGHRAEFINMVRQAHQLDRRYLQPVYYPTQDQYNYPSEENRIQFKD